MCFLCTIRSALGFIISKEGIRVDPFKVEAILNLPAPSSLQHLQILQGNVKFLRRSIDNYAELTQGFNRLLKKGIPFFWDELADKSFDALKHALTNAQLPHPPDYHRDYFLYLVLFDVTVGMVLVQEDVSSNEHVIYCLSRNLTKTEINYAHVES